MELVNSNGKIVISRVEDYDDDVVVKKYIHTHSFVKEIILNEIKMNKKLLKLGIRVIPRIVDIKLNQNASRIYFEKINGSLLSSYKFENISYNEKLNIYYKILNIVKLLHFNNISHNDLNLSNLIITSDKEVYLIDFALATSLSNENKKNDIYSLSYILEYMFKLRLNVEVCKDINDYINKIGNIEDELLYKRRIKIKKL